MSAVTLCAGGTLGAGMLYAERPADRELGDALLRGEFCYVLAPRQMGKSSLRARTEQWLPWQGVRPAVVDLSIIGTKVSGAEWYLGLIEEVADGLGLRGDVLAFWRRHEHLPPVQRWARFLRDWVLREIPGPVVIFVDEIDVVLSLPFLADDFFAAVRSFYNLRASDPAYRRLSFCLLGVAVAGDLIPDPERTPFNIGTCIRLEDFNLEEAQAFLPGLAAVTERPEVVLERVLAWTEGHPYMTHRLCAALARHPCAAEEDEASWIRRMVGDIFLRRGRMEDSNLAAAEGHFQREREGGRTLAMLHLYGQLLDGEPVPAQGSDPVQAALRLTGMAAERQDSGGSWLRVRNPIFAAVFDRAWVAEGRARLLPRPADRPAPGVQRAQRPTIAPGTRSRRRAPVLATAGGLALAGMILLLAGRPARRAPPPAAGGDGRAEVVAEPVSAPVPEDPVAPSFEVSQLPTEARPTLGAEGVAAPPPKRRPSRFSRVHAGLPDSQGFRNEDIKILR